MSMIEYPTDTWDTFCSLADANAILLNLVPDLTKWNDLTDPVKEVYLRQATLLINQRIEELPDTLEDDMKTATAYLANHSIGVDMTNEDGTALLKEKDIAGAIKKVWFTPREASNSLPDVVESLLSQYDLKSSGGFSFKRS